MGWEVLERWGENAARIERFRAMADGLGGAGPVLLAGSTHPGEEKLLGKVFLGLKDEVAGLRFVVVPRHV